MVICDLRALRLHWGISPGRRPPQPIRKGVKGRDGVSRGEPRQGTAGTLCARCWRGHFWGACRLRTFPGSWDLSGRIVSFYSHEGSEDQPGRCPPSLSPPIHSYFPLLSHTINCPTCPPFPCGSHGSFHHPFSTYSANQRMMTLVNELSVSVCRLRFSRPD